MWSFSRVVVGPLLLGKNICDMCFEKYQCDIASYADDTTRHKSDLDLNADFNKIENCANILLNGFKENHTKPNDDKCHHLITIKKSVSVNLTKTT